MQLAGSVSRHRSHQQQCRALQASCATATHAGLLRHCHKLPSSFPSPLPPGAFQLDGSMLHGRTLLNLDTEDWGDVFIGCAGEGGVVV